MGSEERRHDIDWLRTLAVWLLVPFHTGCIYVGWPYLRSEEHSAMTEFIVRFMNVWHMPLLFFLAGAGSWYALRKRDGRGFIKERFYRLFVPLIFGTFIIVPFQPYFTHRWEGTVTKGFFAFYPQFFNGLYPAGNFSYSHLWFLLYLFIFAMVCLPVFTKVYRKHGEAIGLLLTQLGAKPGSLMWLSVPFIIIEVLLRVPFPGLQTFITDWANVLRYCLLYIYGFYYAATPGLADFVAGQRRIWLSVAGIITLALTILLLPLGYAPPPSYNPGNLILLAFGGFLLWMWILVCLGYARHYLNFDNTLLRRFVPISLPFYILHQSILIAIAYYVLTAGFTLYPAFFIIVVLTFIASWLIADFGIRPWKITQLFFGMKGKLH